MDTNKITESWRVLMLTMSKLLEQSTRNTLNLLEKMATDASLQTAAATTNAIASADISIETKALIEAQDTQTLLTKLQLDQRISSMIILPAIDDEDMQQQECRPEENKLAIA